MLKKQIVDTLERIQHEENSKVRYKKIIDFVKNQLKVEVTKNKRGYWFDLTHMSEKNTLELYNLINETK